MEKEEDEKKEEELFVLKSQDVAADKRSINTLSGLACVEMFLIIYYVSVLIRQILLLVKEKYRLFN
jgi:hypothetical protein